MVFVTFSIMLQLTAVALVIVFALFSSVVRAKFVDVISWLINV